MELSNNQRCLNQNMNKFDYDSSGNLSIPKMGRGNEKEVMVLPGTYHVNIEYLSINSEEYSYRDKFGFLSDKDKLSLSTIYDAPFPIDKDKKGFKIYKKSEYLKLKK